MRALPGLLLVTLSFSASAVELRNVRSGVACIKPPLPIGRPEGWVCHQTDRVLLTDQGTCTYNGERRACTWWGVEFDYRNATAGQTLQCRTTFSQVVVSAGPRDKGRAIPDGETYDVELTSTEGHYFAPGYVLFETQDGGRPPPSVTQTTRCRDGTEVVLEFRTEFVHPARAPDG